MGKCLGSINPLIGRRLPALPPLLLLAGSAQANRSARPRIERTKMREGAKSFLQILSSHLHSKMQGAKYFLFLAEYFPGGHEVGGKSKKCRGKGISFLPPVLVLFLFLVLLVLLLRLLVFLLLLRALAKPWSRPTTEIK